MPAQCGHLRVLRRQEAGKTVGLGNSVEASERRGVVQRLRKSQIGRNPRIGGEQHAASARGLQDGRGAPTVRLRQAERARQRRFVVDEATEPAGQGAEPRGIEKERGVRAMGDEDGRPHRPPALRLNDRKRHIRPLDIGRRLQAADEDDRRREQLDETVRHLRVDLREVESQAGGGGPVRRRWAFMLGEIEEQHDILPGRCARGSLRREAKEEGSGKGVKEHGEPIVNLWLIGFFYGLIGLSSGAYVIIQAFLRWVERARTSDRVKAAHTLASAYAGTSGETLDRQAAEMAMTFLLDDPSPKVRLALAEALAPCPHVPRALLLSLAEDQPEIAFPILSRSPALLEDDLIELAARGSCELRAFIAVREGLSRSVSAAIAEIGGEGEALLLLENASARIARRTLKRLSERLGDRPALRDALLARADLPADARQLLAEQVGAALRSTSLVQQTVGEARMLRITREACASAALDMAATAEHDDIPALVEELRATDRLTPSLLLHALCLGRIDFSAAALVALTGLAERRVRSILSDGRVHAVRALYESAGLGRDVSALFAEAMLMRRRESRKGDGEVAASIAAALLLRLRDSADTQALPSGLAELVERLAIAEERRSVRHYALQSTREAA